MYLYYICLLELERMHPQNKNVGNLNDDRIEFIAFYCNIN